MANGFRFRLEVVRRLRRQALDAQRRVVAGAVRSVARAQDRIAQLAQELRGSMYEARDAQQARRVDVVSLRAHQHHRGWLHRRILESEHELERKEAELNTERDKLAEAMKGLKVIEKLREKRKLRYDTAMRRREQAAYDEAALQLYRRRQIA